MRLSRQFRWRSGAVIDVGVDLAWWGVALIAGAPFDAALMTIVQVGPIRVCWYTRDPIGERKRA